MKREKKTDGGGGNDGMYIGGSMGTYKACGACPSNAGHKRISRTDDDNFRPSGTCPTPGLARMHIRPCYPSVTKGKNTQEKVIRVARRTWSSGCPATILRKRSRPSRRVSMTSSENRFVKTLPGRGGMFTRVDSCSSMSRNASKSE